MSPFPIQSALPRRPSLRIVVLLSLWVAFAIISLQIINSQSNKQTEWQSSHLTASNITDRFLAFINRKGRDESILHTEHSHSSNHADSKRTQSPNEKIFENSIGTSHSPVVGERDQYLKERLNVGNFEKLLRTRADETKTVIVAIVNLGYLHFAVNLIDTFRVLGISNYIFICMDRDSLFFFNYDHTNKSSLYEAPVELALKGKKQAFRFDLPLYFNETEVLGIPRDEQSYLSTGYTNLVNMKVWYALRILQLGFNLIMTDVDTWWIRNPLPVISKDADFSFAVDGRVCYHPWKAIVTRHSSCISSLSAGFYYAKSTLGSIAFMEELLKVTHLGSDMEQVALNKIIRLPIIRDGSEIPVTWHELDAAAFPRGNIALKRAGAWCATLREPCKIPIYVAHANYIKYWRKTEVFDEFELWDSPVEKIEYTKNLIKLTEVARKLTANKLAKVRCVNDCSGHGRCNRRGLCICSSDYSGRDCSMYTPRCSPRGIFSPEHKRCICHPAYFGAKCELLRARCTPGWGFWNPRRKKCACRKGFMSYQCEMRTSDRRRGYLMAFPPLPKHTNLSMLYKAESDYFALRKPRPNFRGIPVLNITAAD